MENVILQSNTILAQTITEFVRYLHSEIRWDSRMIAILGARGVGKTTMLLQHIKMNLKQDESLYVKADDLFFTENTLYELAKKFNDYGGRHLVIDEIHKYPNWSRELKMMYDFIPDLQVIFTGSSILEIYKGFADLSRRVLQYHLHGLSFREYLALKIGKQYPSYSLAEILVNKVKIDEQPLPLFKQYLAEGYYPYFGESGYYERLLNTVNQSLEIDIPSFASMNISTSRKLMQLLYVISKSVPFKPNISKLSELTGVHRNLLKDYLVYLERVGLIMQLKEETEGVRLLGKTEKMYLQNSNLSNAISGKLSNIGNDRETFFLNQMRVNQVVTASKLSDFMIDEMTFEIGGKNKAKKQIKGLDKAYVVKDEIEYGFRNTIPLWHFGFNY